jgi:hypothetical protein
VSVSRRRRKIANRLTSRPVSGTISATSDSPTSSPARRRGSLVMANPAHEATSTVSGTVTAATSSEFRM